MPRINNRLLHCIGFARFCMEHKCEPRDVAELLAIAEAHKAAYERSTQDPDPRHAKRAERLSDQFDAKAQAMGFGVVWPGLWPHLTRGGRDIHLPLE